jgi:hypothetical protein
MIESLGNIIAISFEICIVLCVWSGRHCEECELTYEYVTAYNEGYEDSCDDNRHE